MAADVVPWFQAKDNAAALQLAYPVNVADLLQLQSG